MVRIKLEDLYNSLGQWLALAGLLLLSIKLSWANIFLVPLIFLWVGVNAIKLREVVKQNGWYLTPFLFFFFAALVSALFGLNIFRSLKGLLSLGFFACLMPIFKDLASRYGPTKPILALLFGQLIAAAHSIANGALDQQLSGLLVGEVTKSGQLALSLLALAGLILNYHTLSKASALVSMFSIFLALINTVVLVVIGFPSLHVGVYYLSGFAILLAVCWCLYTWRKEIRAKLPPRQSFLLFLTTIVLPILAAALVVNLKRGPWAGVLAGGVCLLLIFERRLIIPLLALALAIIVFVQPVRERLAKSSSDFFIAGGRSVIWDIGMELSSRYPLGVGYRNSPFLQKFSPEIPPELKHFHNNFINIAVENGWIAFALYLSWLAALIIAGLKASPSNPNHHIAVALACALIAWQIAGIVEYNFGDAEVVLIAFCLIGVLAATAKRTQPLSTLTTLT